MLRRPALVAAQLLAVTSSICCTSVSAYRADLAEYEVAYTERSGAIEHRVPRGDHSIAAREYGQAKAGRGQTLVLLHGFPDSQHLYDLVVPHLADDRHVLTFDFLGWGDSDKPADHTYDFRSLDDDLDAVLRYFAPPSVVLVGHDISGPAAVDRALADPTVEALVLLNTVLYRTPRAVRPEAIETFSSTGFVRNLSVWGARTFDSAWIGRHQKQLRRFVVRKEEEVVGLLRALGAQSFDIRPAFFELNSHLRAEMAERAQNLDPLRGLLTPVAILFGTDDPYLNVDVAAELSDLLPRSRTTFFDDAGHYVQVDRPADLAAAIDAFLADETGK